MTSTREVQKQCISFAVLRLPESTSISFVDWYQGTFSGWDLLAAACEPQLEISCSITRVTCFRDWWIKILGAIFITSTHHRNPPPPPLPPLPPQWLNHHYHHHLRGIPKTSPSSSPSPTIGTGSDACLVRDDYSRPRRPPGDRCLCWLLW